MEDAEIIGEFLLESYENIDAFDRDIVALEATPDDVELLANIFRAVHTIKGTSGFLAFNQLEALTHVGENLLAKLRDGQLRLDETLTQLLLEFADTVRVLLETIEAHGGDDDAPVDVAAVIAKLEAALVADTSASTTAVPTAAETAAPPTRVDPAHVAASEAEPPPAAPTPQVPQVEAANVAIFASNFAAHTQANSAPAPTPATPTASAPLTTEPTAADPAAPEPVVSAPVVSEPAQGLPAAPVAASPEAPSAASPPAPSQKAPPQGDSGSGSSRESGTGGGAARSVRDATIRVDVGLLDGLVQQVGELVLTRNQLLQHIDHHGATDLARAAARLDLVVSELQGNIMQTRMQPIGKVWAKLPRIVRDLAHQLDRDVDLQMEGEATELDRSLLEALEAPMTHLVRNALDHGIGTPEQRVAAGKPPTGTLSLSAWHESGQVVVEIVDDGRGIDPDRVAQKAIAQGLISAEDAAAAHPRELINLLFAPGFSTAEAVTNVSGRGVGMDVVRTSIEGIGGSVELHSSLGVGTTCRVRVPLTLAIIPALIVGDDAARYAIPQAQVMELVQLGPDELAHAITTVAGAPVMRLRDQLLPLLSLDEAFGRGEVNLEGLTVVVVTSDELTFGLCVTHVHDTQEIVVKPIGRQLKGLGIYAGATIMGDGQVALILDVAGIAAKHDVGRPQDPDPVEPDEPEPTTQLLVLKVASGQRAAIPLQAVSRLEELDPAHVEHSGPYEVIQYREGILPLVHLGQVLGAHSAPAEASGPLVTVVHDSPAGAVGLVIDEVIDVVDTVVVPTTVGKRPGVLGSAVLMEQVTELIDLDQVVAVSGLGA